MDQPYRIVMMKQSNKHSKVKITKTINKKLNIIHVYCNYIENDGVWNFKN